MAGYITYFALMSVFTGSMFSGFDAQQFYPYKPSISNVLDLPGILGSFLQLKHFHGGRHSVLDRALFVLCVCSLPAIWRLNRLYFAYALFAGILPGLTTWFFSYSRNFMMCFPTFIVLGAWCTTRRRLFCLLLLGAFALQWMFILRYVNCRWAG